MQTPDFWLDFVIVLFCSSTADDVSISAVVVVAISVADVVVVLLVVVSVVAVLGASPIPDPIVTEAVGGVPVAGSCIEGGAGDSALHRFEFNN